jgi:hypothetical protein
VEKLGLDEDGVRAVMGGNIAAMIGPERIKAVREEAEKRRAASTHTSTSTSTSSTAE